jgi:hypothetical protein
VLQVSLSDAITHGWVFVSPMQSHISVGLIQNTSAHLSHARFRDASAKYCMSDPMLQNARYCGSDFLMHLPSGPWQIQWSICPFLLLCVSNIIEHRGIPDTMMALPMNARLILSCIGTLVIPHSAMQMQNYSM